MIIRHSNRDINQSVQHEPTHDPINGRFQNLHRSSLLWLLTAGYSIASVTVACPYQACLKNWHSRSLDSLVDVLDPNCAKNRQCFCIDYLFKSVPINQSNLLRVIPSPLSSHNPTTRKATRHHSIWHFLHHHYYPCSSFLNLLSLKFLLRVVLKSAGHGYACHFHIACFGS